MACISSRLTVTVNSKHMQMLTVIFISLFLLQETILHLKEKPHSHRCMDLDLHTMPSMEIVTASGKRAPALTQTTTSAPGGVLIWAKPIKCFLLKLSTLTPTPNGSTELRFALEIPLTTMATTTPGSLKTVDFWSLLKSVKTPGKLLPVPMPVSQTLWKQQKSRSVSRMAEIPFII